MAEEIPAAGSSGVHRAGEELEADVIQGTGGQQGEEAVQVSEMSNFNLQLFSYC